MAMALAWHWRWPRADARRRNHIRPARDQGAWSVPSRSGSILPPGTTSTAVTSANAITKLLEAAGLRLIRYPGGSWADQYDWSNDTDTSGCAGEVTSSCTTYDPLTFDAISKNARAAGASTFVTVNYGSALPGGGGRLGCLREGDGQEPRRGALGGGERELQLLRDQ